MTSQNLDEYMVKFQGQLSIKQYVESKLIKTVFKIFCRCVSKTGYLYQFDFHFRKKENAEENLGGSLVLTLKKSLEKTYCIIFSTISSTSLNFLQSFLTKVSMHLGMLEKTENAFPKVTKGKDIKRGDHEFLFAEKKRLL